MCCVSQPATINKHKQVFTRIITKFCESGRGSQVIYERTFACFAQPNDRKIRERVARKKWYEKILSELFAVEKLMSLFDRTLIIVGIMKLYRHDSSLLVLREMRTVGKRILEDSAQRLVLFKPHLVEGNRNLIGLAQFG